MWQRWRTPRSQGKSQQMPKKIKVSPEINGKLQISQRFPRVGLGNVCTAAKGFTWYENASCHRSDKAFLKERARLARNLHHEKKY